MAGDAELLDAERRLHQRYRWEMNLPLRFEAQHWMRAFYAAWQPPDWTKGNLNYLEYQRPVHLLRKRIIDAWLCGAPDCPDQPDLACVPLYEMPMLLVARRDHPLLRRQAPLTLADAAAYPLLPLPQGAFPVFEAQLKQLGLGGAPAEIPPDPSGLAAAAPAFADLCLGIASALTLPLYGEEMVPLPLEVPIRFGDVLVIRAEFMEHRRSQALLESLQAHIRAATAKITAVRMLESRWSHHAATTARLA